MSERIDNGEVDEGQRNSSNDLQKFKKPDDQIDTSNMYQEKKSQQGFDSDQDLQKISDAQYRHYDSYFLPGRPNMQIEITAREMPPNHVNFQLQEQQNQEQFDGERKPLSTQGFFKQIQFGQVSSASSRINSSSININNSNPMPMPASQQLLVMQETKQFEQSSSSQVQHRINTQNNIPNGPHKPLGLPGQSKNIAKNLIRCLKTFIRLNVEFTSGYPTPVFKLLNLDTNKSGKHKLQKFMRSQSGRLICREFFANYQYGFHLIRENKSSPEQYEKFCRDYYNQSLNN